MPDKRTSIQDWSQYYHSRNHNEACHKAVNFNDFRNTPHKLILSEIGKIIDAKRNQDKEPNILEIGAGDSNILIDIANRYNLKNEIYGLDYLQEACLRLRKKAEKQGIPIKTICADLFSPPPALLGRFDIVLSFGVVEHFTDLTHVIEAISKYASKNGLVFTLIPNNKDGIYGWMMKKFNKKVYDSHVLYSKSDLENAHNQAGLQVLQCKYLVSSNFGMLSWCFADRKRGFLYWIYKQLTRVSKTVWFFESKFGHLKPVSLFAPYILCTAVKKK